MREPSEMVFDGIATYNLRRWTAWVIALCSLLWGGYQLGNVSGLCIGLGVYALAVAVSQEIRAAVFPIGMAAIGTLGSKMKTEP
jgi:hypothetical protein